jgi:hypothetical protein
MQDFLEAQGVQPDKKDAILQIIAGVGFKVVLDVVAASCQLLPLHVLIPLPMHRMSWALRRA